MQHRRWIGGISLRTTVAFVAAAILLMVTASQRAEAQTFTTLHSFSGLDGGMPTAGLTMDGAGNLYGTTQYGGTADYGSVFKLVHTGGSWILHPLYSFPNDGGGNDGAEPYAGVTIGPDGNLYGTTTRGGGSAAYGTVFKLSPPASVCRSTLCPWRETILHRFSGGSDGIFPYGAVVFDTAGNLYGTTNLGGTGTCYQGFGCGVVFKLTRSGSTWTETVVYNFRGRPDGAYPVSGLVFDQAGNLYGTTSEGGINNCPGNDGCGTVFQLAPSGSGWTENVIHIFNWNTDGGYPAGGLILDNAGNLYGTTESAPLGNGTVFELTHPGGQWTYTLLYSFMSGQGGLGGPLGTLAMDAAGDLYGTTIQGGIGDCYGECGIVFKLTPSTGSWAYTLLYDFTDGTDGGQPYDGLIFDRNGNLYGTASIRAGGGGTVFEITP
jgi:uncharacterized repeat protein (TIGR03803 family)